MTLIGIEEHVLTPEVTEAWHALGLAAVDPSVAFHPARSSAGCWIWARNGSP
ncbi:hypothetical protein [Bosea sp. UC22_33]|uniref:hypothetical protein n=1 Tax=Bosea sp. UC22_33 TaxID=3350165 RepID=UPI00366D7D7E